MDLERNVFKTHTFSFGDCCIAVGERAREVERSPARVLFFLHGRFGFAEMWRHVLGPLDPAFRCFVVDLPGFGKSYSSSERGLSILEQANLIRSLILYFTKEEDEVFLIGHDIGATLVQLSAAGLPEEIRSRLRGLILINGTILDEPIRGIRAGWFGLSARWRLMRLLSQTRGLHPDTHRELMRPWNERTTRAALIQALRAIEGSWPGPFERQVWRSEIRKLSMPILLLWGGKDPLNPAEVGMQMIQELKDAVFFEHSGAGHWPPLEHPDWVRSKIQEFLFQIPARKVA